MSESALTFKPGELAVCINNSRVQKKLTLNKEYHVISVSDGLYVGERFTPAINVHCDDGVERWYPVDRFKLKAI